jgi:hypothetical protein
MFRAVVFSANWPQDAEDGETLRHCFVKGSQKDSFGRQVTVAIQVSAYMLKDLDPSLNIINYLPWFPGEWTQELLG